MIGVYLDNQLKVVGDVDLGSLAGLSMSCR
jgi:hypothetical protein